MTTKIRFEHFKAAIRNRFYSNPRRTYHNWDHIQHCLREFYNVSHLCKNSFCVEMAIYFHDAEYSEEQSARIAKEWLSKIVYFSNTDIEKVCSLILVTKHKDILTDKDEQYIADIDVSIFGQPELEFNAYEDSVSQEYVHLTKEEYARGRQKVLWNFLLKPKIYYTESFQERYEMMARKNLVRSLTKLAFITGSSECGEWEEIAPSIVLQSALAFLKGDYRLEYYDMNGYWSKGWNLWRKVPGTDSMTIVAVNTEAVSINEAKAWADKRLFSSPTKSQ